MRRLRFWTNFLFLLIPLSILCAGAFRLVQQIWGYLNSNARLAGVLSVEATRALGREVRVGDVRLTGNLWSLSAANRLELRDVFIAEEPAAPTSPFARAESVVIWYNLRQILLTEDLRVPLVSEVHLEHPQVSVSRDAKGRWNFETLFKPGAKAGRPFLDKLSLTNGTVFYADQAFPRPNGVPARPLVTRADRVSGIVLIRPDKSAAFDVSGLGTPQTMRDFHAVGTADVDRFRFNAWLTAHSVSLPFAGERLLPPARGKISAGYADLDVTALYLPAPGASPRKLDMNAFDAHGSLQVSKLAANIPALNAPLRGTKAALRFTTDAVVGDVSGLYGGTPVALSGSVLNLRDRSCCRRAGRAAPHRRR